MVITEKTFLIRAGVFVVLQTATLPTTEVDMCLLLEAAMFVYIQNSSWSDCASLSFLKLFCYL